MTTIQRMQPILGTYVEITLSAVDSKESALIKASERAFARMWDVHTKMSFQESESELSKLNSLANTRPVKVSPDTRRVLETALEISRQTSGLFDVTVGAELAKQGRLPDRLFNTKPVDWQAIKLTEEGVFFEEPVLIDLSGIAKGYAVDVAFEAILALPVTFDQVVVNAGGDLRMLKWQTETASIKTRGLFGVRKLVEMPMRAASLAASRNGSSNRSSHIVNPQTMKAATGKRTYCVFSETCMLADAFTKVAALMQKDDGIFSLFGAEVVHL